MSELKIGDRVKVIKNRISNDPFLGKTGLIVGKTWAVDYLWVVRIDGETYSEDGTGSLLNPDEIERIEEIEEFDHLITANEIWDQVEASHRAKNELDKDKLYTVWLRGSTRVLQGTGNEIQRIDWDVDIVGLLTFSEITAYTPIKGRQP